MPKFFPLQRSKIAILSTFLILSIICSNFVFSQEENRPERRGRGESTTRPATSRPEIARATTPPAARQPVARPETTRPTTPPAARQPVARPETTNGRPNPGNRPGRPTDDTQSVVPNATIGSLDSGEAASLQQRLDNLNSQNRGNRGQNRNRSEINTVPGAIAELAPLSDTLAIPQDRGGRQGNISERGRGGGTGPPNSSRSSSGRDVVIVRPAPPPPPRPVVRPQVVVNIQTGFRGYGTYWTPDWYVRHAHYNYWRPPVVIAPTIWWRTPNWGVTWTWFNGYAPYYYRPAYYTPYVYHAPPTPVYYNYGDNIVYRGDMVYVNGVPYVSADKYYEQGLELAKRGENTTVININQPQTVETTVINGNDKPLDVPVPELPFDPKEQSADPSEQWMPLGTFALLDDEETGASDRVFQLAMNRGGILRGNLYDQGEDKLLPIQGAIDQETQRVAFRVVGDDEKVYECGLWNLTQESLSLLVQAGDRQSETIKVVRLQENESGEN